MLRALLAVLVVALPWAAAAQDLEARARALHRDAIVVDGHNDVPMLLLDLGFDLGMDGAAPDTTSPWPWFFLSWLPGRPAGEELRTDTDLARMERGGLDAQFFSIWVDPDHYDPERPGVATARAQAMIDAVLEQVQRHPERLALAKSAEDVRRIVASGRHAALMGLEGGHAIEDDLGTLRRYHAQGVRYMTLTWSFSHTWADSSGDAGGHGGLTEFGRDVVREMNDLGMLVDVSHVSDPTFWDALETSRAPVIASHSSARSIAPHPRNLSDDMLRAVGESGGVVMLNFGGIFLDPRKVGTWNHVKNTLRYGFPVPTTLAMLADHVEHVARVAGVDHVGLGSDFDGTLFLPDDMRTVEDFPNLTVELARRGWSDADLRKLLGENLLRVLARTQALASAPGAR
ncbi:MAG: dipeptidase [Deltaproteobacteria bacterium]|nr:dipeptidase [Deltaproteobacteria bacterium]